MFSLDGPATSANHLNARAPIVTAAPSNAPAPSTALKFVPVRAVESSSQDTTIENQKRQPLFSSSLATAALGLATTTLVAAALTAAELPGWGILMFVGVTLVAIFRRS